MSSLPLPEAILLEIHQSLGCPSYPTKIKKNFSEGHGRIENHLAKLEKIRKDIFDALNMDSLAREDAWSNFMEFSNAYKELEQATWTFAADQRQILWMLLGYFYLPGLARYVAYWNIPDFEIHDPMDKGMPGGRFWYLPELREVAGKADVYMPVAQVVDWLLDLLGVPVETFAAERSRSIITDSSHDVTESLMRSLFNWRTETIPSFDTIKRYFPD